MTDVIIVGAGHAGLAASACLQTHGIEHCVLERGQIGELAQPAMGQFLHEHAELDVEFAG